MYRKLAVKGPIGEIGLAKLLHTPSPKIITEEYPTDETIRPNIRPSCNTHC